MGREADTILRNLAARAERQRAKGVLQIDVAEQIPGTYPSELQSKVGLTQLWSPVGAFKTKGTGAASFVTAIVPANTQTLGIAIPSNLFALSNLTVTGRQSGLPYLLATSTAYGWTMIPTNAALDQEFVISWTAAGAAGLNIQAFASPLYPGLPRLGFAPLTSSLPVGLAGNQFWLWANNVPVAPLFAAGANQVVIAGVAAQSIYLFGLSVGIAVAGGAGSTLLLLDGSAGNPVFRAAAAVLGPHYFDGHGAQLTSGNGLYVTVPAACSAAVSVSYSQG